MLEILDLESSFNFIATRDDVEHGKPDPEIYLLVSAELGVRPEECLVLEDSASGVRAALTTGMSCIAITTPFSRQGVHNLGLLEERWIVDDPGQVAHAVRRMLDERKLDPK